MLVFPVGSVVAEYKPILMVWILVVPWSHHAMSMDFRLYRGLITPPYSTMLTNAIMMTSEDFYSYSTNAKLSSSSFINNANFSNMNTSNVSTSNSTNVKTFISNANSSTMSPIQADYFSYTNVNAKENCPHSHGYTFPPRMDGLSVIDSKIRIELVKQHLVWVERLVRAAKKPVIYYMCPNQPKPITTQATVAYGSMYINYQTDGITNYLFSGTLNNLECVSEIFGFARKVHVMYPDTDFEYAVNDFMYSPIISQAIVTNSTHAVETAQESQPIEKIPEIIAETEEVFENVEPYVTPADEFDCLLGEFKIVDDRKTKKKRTAPKINFVSPPPQPSPPPKTKKPVLKFEKEDEVIEEPEAFVKIVRKLRVKRVKPEPVPKIKPEEPVKKSEPESFVKLPETIVTFTKANIFASNVTNIAHCVSRDLAMSAGFAKEVRNRYYGRTRPEVDLSNPLANLICDVTKGKTLYHMITKEARYHKPTLVTLKTALEELCQVSQHQIIHMPFIGTGLDKLNKEDVLLLIEVVFKAYGKFAVIHEIVEHAPDKFSTVQKIPQVTPIVKTSSTKIATNHFRTTSFEGKNSTFSEKEDVEVTRLIKLKAENTESRFSAFGAYAHSNNVALASSPIRKMANVLFIHVDKLYLLVHNKKIPSSEFNVTLNDWLVYAMIKNIKTAEQAHQLASILAVVHVSHGVMFEQLDVIYAYFLSVFKNFVTFIASVCSLETISEESTTTFISTFNFVVPIDTKVQLVNNVMLNDDDLDLEKLDFNFQSIRENPSGYLQEILPSEKKVVLQSMISSFKGKTFAVEDAAGFPVQQWKDILVEGLLHAFVPMNKIIVATPSDKIPSLFSRNTVRPSDFVEPQDNINRLNAVIPLDTERQVLAKTIFDIFSDNSNNLRQAILKNVNDKTTLMNMYFSVIPHSTFTTTKVTKVEPEVVSLAVYAALAKDSFTKMKALGRDHVSLYLHFSDYFKRQACAKAMMKNFFNDDLSDSTFDVFASVNMIVSSFCLLAPTVPIVGWMDSVKNMFSSKLSSAGASFASGLTKEPVKVEHDISPELKGILTKITSSPQINVPGLAGFSSELSSTIRMIAPMLGAGVESIVNQIAEMFGVSSIPKHPEFSVLKVVTCYILYQRMAENDFVSLVALASTILPADLVEEVFKFLASVFSNTWHVGKHFISSFTDHKCEGCMFCGDDKPVSLCVTKLNQWFPLSQEFSEKTRTALYSDRLRLSEMSVLIDGEPDVAKISQRREAYINHINFYIQYITLFYHNKYNNLKLALPAFLSNKTIEGMSTTVNLINRHGFRLKPEDFKESVMNLVKSWEEDTTIEDTIAGAADTDPMVCLAEKLPYLIPLYNNQLTLIEFQNSTFKLRSKFIVGVEREFVFDAEKFQQAISSSPVEEEEAPPPKGWLCWLKDQITDNAGVVAAIIGVVLIGLLGYSAHFGTYSYQRIGKGIIDMFRSFRTIMFGMVAIPQMFVLLLAAYTWILKKAKKFTNPVQYEIENYEGRMNQWLIDTSPIMPGFFEAAMTLQPSLGYMYMRRYVEGLVLCSHITKVDVSLALTFKRNWLKFSELHSKVIALLEIEAGRPEPYHIQHTGKSGIGKSNPSAKIAKILAEVMKIQPRVYPGNFESKYMDNYNGEEILNYDDLHLTTEVDSYNKQIYMFSSAPVITEQASLEKKGTMLKCKLVISNTNNPYPQYDGVTNIEALWRRRCLVDIKQQPTVQDPTCDCPYTSKMLFTILNETDPEGKAKIIDGKIYENMNWSQYVEIMSTLAANHVKMEEARAEQYGKLDFRKKHELFMKRLTDTAFTVPLDQIEAFKQFEELYPDLLDELRNPESTMRAKLWLERNAQKPIVNKEWPTAGSEWFRYGSNHHVALLSHFKTVGVNITVPESVYTMSTVNEEVAYVETSLGKLHTDKTSVAKLVSCVEVPMENPNDNHFKLDNVLLRVTYQGSVAVLDDVGYDIKLSKETFIDRAHFDNTAHSIANGLVHLSLFVNAKTMFNECIKPIDSRVQERINADYEEKFKNKFDQAAWEKRCNVLKGARYMHLFLKGVGKLFSFILYVGIVWGIASIITKVFSPKSAPIRYDLPYFSKRTVPVVSSEYYNQICQSGIQSSFRFSTQYNMRTYRFMAICIGGTVFATNKHCFHGLDEQTEIMFEIIDPIFHARESETSAKAKVCLRTSNIKSVPGSDLVFFSIPDYRSGRDIRSKFLSEKDLKNDNLAGARGYTIVERGNGTMQLDSLWGLRLNEDIAYGDEDGPQFFNKRVIRCSGTSDITRGDSGGLVGLFEHRLDNHLLGILAATNGSTLTVIPITKELANEYFAKFTAIERIIREDVPFIPVPKNSPMLSVITAVPIVGGYAPPVYVPTKTKYRKSIFHADLAHKCSAEPAILSSKDPRAEEVLLINGRTFDYTARNKYGGPSAYVDLKVMKKIAMQLASKDAQLIDGARVLTTTEAITGSPRYGSTALKLSTGAGLPYKQLSNKSGKHEWINFNPTTGTYEIDHRLLYDVKIIEDKLAEGIIPHSLMECVLKDELRNQDKLGDTRSVFVPPLPLTVVHAKYTKDVWTALKSVSPVKSRIMVGSNLETTVWDDIVQDGKWVDHVICLDIKKWDSWFPRVFATSSAAYMYRVLQLHYASRNEPLPKNLELILYTLYKIYSQPLIVNTDVIIEGDHAMISGCNDTATNNSKAHQTIDINRYYHICDKNNLPHLKNLESYFLIVKLLVLGDDELKFINPLYAHIFGPEAWREAYEAIGCTVTAADKSDIIRFVNINQASFLKMGFRFSTDHNRWVINPEESIIWKLLAWISNTLPEDEQLSSNLDTAMRFAYWRGSKFYREASFEIEAMCLRHRFAYNMPSYEEVALWIRRDLSLSKMRREFVSPLTATLQSL